MRKKFYTYVLRSQYDGKFYVGFTEDIENRLLEHNTRRVTATKNRVPFILEYYEVCFSKEKAVRREKQLKTGYGRKYIKDRI